MEVDHKLLKTIHRILVQRADLSGRKERGPRQIALAQSAEKKFEEELSAAIDSRKKALILADEKQLQLSEREAKIESLTSKLNAAESNREFQLLKDQIAADEQANSVLSDEILELLEKIDTLVANLAVARENLEKAKQETKKVTQRVAVETANLDAELGRVAAELEQCERQFKGDAITEYRRLVVARGEDALAETDLETCGKCNTRISAQTLSELMLKRVVFCKSCGSLMYVSENQPTASSD